MLSPGDKAPSFTLPSVDGGGEVSDPWTEGPTVLAFFKVSCPVCKMVAPMLTKLSEAGVRVVAVGEDPPDAIAAYNEAEGIGSVLDAIPSASCGLPVDTLVVVDGATDDTAAVAARHGAMVCVAPRNRGQGAALRLGYALARERGAQYVVTTDADGQYDMTELPLLLEPLLAGEADFVTGSRRLGRQETTDPVRHLGVRVFAAVASALTGRRITDTSFGFRAMRAEVTGVVRLAQPQYQASELLLEVISGGFRAVEQPMTMLARTAGETKKGNNLVYGLRYGRVLVGTWARQRFSRRFAAPKTSRSNSRNLTTNSRT